MSACELCGGTAGVAWDSRERRELCSACREDVAAVGVERPAAHERPADSARRPARRGTPLTAPAAGADRVALLDWLTTSLRLPVPVARVDRWGRSAGSPIAIVLADGRRLRFEEAADLNHGGRLAETVILALDADAPALPVFSRSDAQTVLTVVVRAADAVGGVEEAERTRAWQDELLRLGRAVHHGAYEDAAARWRALTWLATEPGFDASIHRAAATNDERARLPVLVWASGASYVRVRDATNVVRGVIGEPIREASVIGRFEEAGWRHRRAEAWRPGAGRQRSAEDRVRVSVFEVPPALFDGLEEDVSPASPSSTAPARTPARTSGAWGHLGTPAGSPMGAGDPEPGDTGEAGDTFEGERS